MLRQRTHSGLEKAEIAHLGDYRYVWIDSRFWKKACSQISRVIESAAGAMFKTLAKLREAALKRAQRTGRRFDNLRSDILLIRSTSEVHTGADCDAAIFILIRR
jgi:hypothetical protein